jgi:hypothetical protein
MSKKRAGLPTYRDMAKPIVVSIPHSLGAEEAQRRLTQGLGRLEQEFKAFLSSSSVAWKANHADLAVGAMGQYVRAGIDVFDDMVRLEVQLPWLLSRLQTRVAEFLERQGHKALQISNKSRV